MSLPEHLHSNALARAESPAISRDALSLSYGQLETQALKLALCIRALVLEEQRGSSSIPPSTHEQHEPADAVNAPPRVALLLPPGPLWATSLLACWKAGVIAVPLAWQHPPAEWAHMLSDAGAGLILSTPDRLSELEQCPGQEARSVMGISDPLEDIDQLLAGQSPQSTDLRALEQKLPVQAEEALLIYTSGSTGKPKGVLHTHAQLSAQIQSLIQAWVWQPTDHIVNVLPLHHIHGIVNVYLCALWSGARITELGGFDSAKVWNAFEQWNPSLFMAVPTIYQRLLQAYQRAEPGLQARWTQACPSFRLMVSGSAALRPELLGEWEQISGQVLLERYGMTEIGMALSNPLEGKRRAGWVGYTLPGVECRVMNEQGQLCAAGVQGELQVRGPGVFSAYWQKPEATAECFEGSWFKTGDMALFDESGCFRILGRLSVDIIKSGGYKVSALEIEAEIRQFPGVEDCAVVGLSDPEWGQRVAAVLVMKEGAEKAPELEALRRWGRERLASYKLPSVLLFLSALPLNAMGKVNKVEILRLLEEHIS